MESQWRSLVLTWCCGWPWRLDATESPGLAKLRPNPHSAKCIYEGISLYMYFASTRILKGTEPLAFLLNRFVVVETKGETQFRAKFFNFSSEPWELIIYTQTSWLSVRTFHGIVVEALTFAMLVSWVRVRACPTLSYLDGVGQTFVHIGWGLGHVRSGSVRSVVHDVLGLRNDKR